MLVACVTIAALECYKYISNVCRVLARLREIWKHVVQEDESRWHHLVKMLPRIPFLNHWCWRFSILSDNQHTVGCIHTVARTELSYWMQKMVEGEVCGQMSECIMYGQSRCQQLVLLFFEDCEDWRQSWWIFVFDAVLTKVSARSWLRLISSISCGYILLQSWRGSRQASDGQCATKTWARWLEHQNFWVSYWGVGLVGGLEKCWSLKRSEKFH